MRSDASQNRKQDATEPVDIREVIDLFQSTSRLFRSHVQRRPEHSTGERTTDVMQIAWLRISVNVIHSRVVVDLRETPVEQHNLAEAVERDVLWFEVAVNDVSRMSVGDGLTNVDECSEHPMRHHGFVLTRVATFVILDDGVVQSSLAEKTHGIEATSGFFVGTKLIDRHDSGMLQPARDFRFTSKVSGRLFIVTEMAGDFFDGDIAS